MKVFILLCIVGIVIAKKQKKCPPHSHKGSVSGCPATCDQPKPGTCQVYTDGCACDDGYLPRTANVKKPDCVPESQCSPPPYDCPSHSHYGGVSGCSATCDNPDPGAATCNSATNGCACDDGYLPKKADLQNPDCVPKTQCPPPPYVCPPHSTYGGVSGCPATCENPRPGNCASATNGCACDKGYLPRKNNLQHPDCVPESQCPPPSYGPKAARASPRCPNNEHYERCGDSCDTDCSTYYNPDPNCDSQCQDGCYCDGGLYRNQTGTCVTSDQCPYCGPNAEYTTCATCPERTCERPEKPQFCSQVCRTGCRCKDGYYRKLGICVTYDQCRRN